VGQKQDGGTAGILSKTLCKVGQKRDGGTAGTLSKTFFFLKIFYA
jgi:hypothetical protein